MEKRHIPSLKIDQNIGDKSKLSFYMSNYLYYANARADALPAPITSQRNRKIFADTYELHYDYIATPTTVLHFGFGFVRGDHDDNYLPASLAFVPASIGLNGSYTTGMPVISTLGNSTVGGFSTAYGIGVGSPVVNLADKPTLNLNATNVRGNHTYKIGLQWRLDTTINKNAIAAPTYTFSGNETALPYLQTATVGGNTIGLPYASYLLGLVDSASVRPHARSRLPQDLYGVVPARHLEGHAQTDTRLWHPVGPPDGAGGSVLPEQHVRAVHSEPDRRGSARRDDL